MRAPLSLLLTLLLLPSAPAAELPVRKVILYKHGIGYFERNGEIPAGQSARIDFKSDEMNDVLKSLTVVDTSGNTVTGVRYDSSQPLAQKLAEYPFKLGDRASLADFLDQVKGAAIEVNTGPAKQRGQIVSARAAQSREKAQTSTEYLSLLLESGEIATVDLAGISGLKLLDPELQRQLSDYLRNLNASRSREQKSVYIDSTRDAARKLGVAYTIPMPVWKSSYRLVLDAGAQKKPQLEGWAIIDNTTNEDWTKVDLSVISGRPISFVSRLYEPRLVQRQTAELEEEAPIAPTVYRAAAAPAPPAANAPQMNQMNKLQASAGYSMTVEAEAQRLQTSTSSVAVSTAAREAGELFEYKFSQPVTVKRNESAMLPFVQQPIEARKLVIYTENSPRENPMNSAELTNTTGKTLDGGPLSVFDAGVYAGEALVDTFKPGDKRLISYAMDLGTRVVEDENEGDQVVTKLTASRGVVTRQTTTDTTKTYKFTNVDKKPKTIVVEHAIRRRFTLLSPKATEETKTHYRFEVKLTGDREQTLVVKTQEANSEEILISQMNDDQLAELVVAKRLNATAKQQLSELAALRRQLADSTNFEKNLQQQITDITNDQERVRRNLGSLNSVSGQQERVQKYAADLANLDQQIGNLKTQVVAEVKKRTSLVQQLAAKIEALNF